MPFFFSVTYAAAKHMALMSQNGKSRESHETKKGLVCISRIAKPVPETEVREGGEMSLAC